MTFLPTFVLQTIQAGADVSVSAREHLPAMLADYARVKRRLPVPVSSSVMRVASLPTQAVDVARAGSGRVILEL